MGNGIANIDRLQQQARADEANAAARLAAESAGKATAAAAGAVVMTEEAKQKDLTDKCRVLGIIDEDNQPTTTSKCSEEVINKVLEDCKQYIPKYITSESECSLNNIKKAGKKQRHDEILRKEAEEDAALAAAEAAAAAKAAAAEARKQKEYEEKVRLQEETNKKYMMIIVSIVIFLIIILSIVLFLKYNSSKPTPSPPLASN